MLFIGFIYVDDDDLITLVFFMGKESVCVCVRVCAFVCEWVGGVKTIGETDF